MSAKKISKFSPARILLGSIILTIVIGTLLLALPISRHQPIDFLDLFFTASSLTTVTGLSTIPSSAFTTFGHCVMLLLMQIGGLGLITMTLFLLSLFVELGFTTQLMAGQLLELESWKNIKKLLIFIISLTVLSEGIGALLVFWSIKGDYPLGQAWLYSIFHSISAFCSAGFNLFPNGISPFKTNWLFLITTSSLMLFGGLGFITWNDIIGYIKALRRKKRYILSLHSKIVLYTTAMLVISAVVLYWILEHNNTFYGLSTPYQILNSVFNACASRSAGFSTVFIPELQMATLFMITITAFIGSSPGSTGSGIKTTTFAIFMGTIRSTLLGRTAVELQGRRIPKDQVYKALAVISLSLGWVIFTTFCLLITEKSWQFLDILFEVISAFATLGLSTGVTPNLTLIGKILIIITMIIGRIGSITFVLALKRRTEPKEFSYPEERIMIG